MNDGPPPAARTLPILTDRTDSDFVDGISFALTTERASRVTGTGLRSEPALPGRHVAEAATEAHPAALPAGLGHKSAALGTGTGPEGKSP